MAFSCLAVLACVFLQAAPVSETPPSPGGLSLLDHAALTTELGRLAEEHGELVSRIRLGTSREGRAIEGLGIAAPEREPDWPAILLVANLEGPRVFATAVAVQDARRLAEGYEEDEDVRSLLRGTVVYVVPCANPDAAAARFATPRIERRTGGHGVDDDRDGRQGEDPPSDVNGDGLVTMMRVSDPEGTWIPDPTDARALVEADPAKGERGRFKLYPEGRDLDGDESVAEDPPHDTRLDRNFPAGWKEHAADAGLFPGDEPEARALMEFVLQHQNIALVLTYDELDDLVEKPKSVKDDARPVKRVPPPGLLESDAKLIAEIGRRYREITGSKAKGAASDAGTFQRWCYEHRGLVTLNAVLWEMPKEKPSAEGDEAEGDEPSRSEQAQEGEGGEKEHAETKKEHGAEDVAKPSDDAKRLAWIDSSGESWRFVDWKPFDHPELGPVEIGGFAPFARIEPPVSEQEGIADAQFRFLVGLGKLLARVRLAELEVEALGADLWRVKAVVENDALMPLLSRSARRTRTTRPAHVEILLPEAAHLIAGEREVLVRELRGSGGRHEISWLVQGPAGMELAVGVDTDHAGSDRKTVEVGR